MQPSRKQSPQLLLVLSYLLLGMGSLHSQSFIYSGREYRKVGKSYWQIRFLDIATGKQKQLSISARDHSIPFCTSDGSIFFTIYGEHAIYRLDPVTGKESIIMPIAHELGAFIGDLDNQRVAVQVVGNDFGIEILDLKTGRSIKNFKGVSASVSPDHKFIAYEYPPSDPHVVSHVYIAEIHGDKVLDMGEGATPAFFPNGEKIAYTLAQKSKDSSQIETIIYDLKKGTRDSKIFTAANRVFDWFYDLTIAPDGITMILSNAEGQHGSGAFYLLQNGSATKIDESLQGWAGWSTNGLLLYATERDIRELAGVGGVWVYDIKAFDLHTGKIRTLIKGISANEDPCWCSPH
jgi:Tol biopolymer transport system component